MKWNMKSINLASIVFLSAVSAFATSQDSLAKEQKSLLEKLDSLNDAVLGLKVNGSAKAGVVSSKASSDEFSDISPTRQSEAYTDVNFIITARPSSETEVRVEARLHKDWQSAYEENNNPVIGHWFSYDGLILNKHLAFNLGYMRVGYTPYTLFTPQPSLLQEPEIFAESRIEALSKRNLDTTSRRLLQGINADYHSGAVGIFDDIHAQASGARLRNIAKKNDQVFMDFDWSDRYMYGGRLGADVYGAHLGVNYVSVFDRRLSTSSHDLDLKDTIILDDNKIFSAELGFNSAKVLPDLPVTFGVFGEMAFSWWNADRRYSVTKSDTSYVIRKDAYPNADGGVDTIAYLAQNISSNNIVKTETYGDDNGLAFYIEPYVKGVLAGIDFQLKGCYLQNDKEFWSELASAPSYRNNTVVLNANALYSDDVYTALVSTIGMSSLENLYFQVYNSNPLNATNIMSSASANVLSGSLESGYMYSRLYNNYKNAHFYRNGYNADTQKRLEAEEVVALLDPSVNMALPYGLATPDRKGFAVQLDVNYNESVELNAEFSQYNQDAIDNTYMQYAVGLGVQVGRLLGLEQKILVQGSYDHAEEDAYFERSSDRIMAGFTAEIWGPFGILGGFSQVTKEYGNPMFVTANAAITKAEEMLLRVGPRIKIAPASYLSFQYGLLTDKVSFLRSGVDADGVTPVVAKDELSIDKSIIMADITVTF